MKVSPNQPFQIVYSLYEHQYLGYLLESFVVQRDDHGRLSFLHQNISSVNASEFADGLDQKDYELIKLIDDIQQDAIIKKFYTKRAKAMPEKFFFTVFDPQKGDKVLQDAINQYLSMKRGEIMKRLTGKYLFEMANDGEPTHQRITIEDERASVLFHFRRNDDSTHYFITIKHKGGKLEFLGKNAMILCTDPAWVVLDNRLFHFKKDVDGNKFKPFIKKKFVRIPKEREEEYYKKFVASIVEQYDVYAVGFDIKTHRLSPKASIVLQDLPKAKSLTLFGDNNDAAALEEDKVVMSLVFTYDHFDIGSDPNKSGVSVSLDKDGDKYCFNKVIRDTQKEAHILSELHKLGMDMRNGKITKVKTVAFAWITESLEALEKLEVEISQGNHEEKRYFIGSSHISIEIKENRDWFDIHAIVKFGNFEIPFLKLRKLILAGQKEMKLPNGEFAVIPETWFAKYGELFHFMEEHDKGLQLKKHHLALVHEMREGNHANVVMSRKLEALRDFAEIEDIPVPKGFQGTLRPYQKAGYNWMCFLNNYKFGGCLADDMGLGKTVQTLTLLQKQKEDKPGLTSLLIMPTSLLYNWEMEAKRFTPELRVLNYTGTNRQKNSERFAHYDLVLTSYGITRIDVDVLSEFHFNYVILDEAQAIKNPTSNIAKAVRNLNASHRLVLTGTPVENSTLDLWSQMSFVNPGLLGSQHFFKKEFQLPIEKKQSHEKNLKLNTIIKPFILRRHKSQVATELPPKVENIQFCVMTSEQEKEYEEVKSQYRNKILESLDSVGMGGTQFVLLQGLSMLRQLANHPKMVKPEYEGDSGKLEDITYKLQAAISENHKILIFSQFVKHLSILKKYIEEQGITYAYLDGATKNRQAEVDKFQNDENTKVFLISLKAGGVGLNLTAADYVFILDPWWNPAIEAQAINRAHRIGQTKNVMIYKFITKGTVEEKILALQKSKQQLADDLINVEETFMKQLTKEDIEHILE